MSKHRVTSAGDRPTHDRHLLRNGRRLRRLARKNHATATEFHVGAHRKASGLGGMTYLESVDQALCFGWIDGIVRKIDETSFSLRFTPRKPGSIWSNINVAHVARLTAAGLMRPAGLAAFAARDAKRTGVYAFERATAPELPAAYADRFRADKKAWAFFQAQPPGYRHLALHRVINPKREATRQRWLARLIAASAAGHRLE